MEQGETSRSRRRRSSYERLVIIGLAAVAVVSPLFIDRRSAIESELDEQPIINISSYLPLLLLVLIVAIAFSCYLDRNFSRFDPYWIYRVGGSSGGIILLLMVLALVLKCKASPEDWDDCRVPVDCNF